MISEIKHCYDCFRLADVSEFCDHNHEHSRCKKCCESDKEALKQIAKMSLWELP